MKRVMDERVLPMPHDIFTDNESDTDSATSNIDEDKREPSQFFRDGDHDYFTPTFGLSSILGGMDPTVSASGEEIPSSSNKKFSVPTPQNEKLAEPRKTLTTPNEKLAEPRKTLRTPNEKLAEPRKILPKPNEKPPEPRKTLTTLNEKRAEPRKTPAAQNEKPMEPAPPPKPPTDEEMAALLDQVVVEVNGSLVGPLFAKRSGSSGISVLWITNSRPTSVIGEIFVSSSGEVEVYIKGYQLNANHDLWTKIPAPVPLANGGVERFVKHVNHAVMVTRGFTICAAVTEQKHLWDDLTGVSFERNQFREPDVCRTESCDLLVHPQRIRCSECKSLNVRIRSRKKKKTADKVKE